jgi:hypothetical protein
MMVGEKMDWHKIVSNYGHVSIIRVAVRKIGDKRVTVEVPLKNGGTRLVCVHPHRLHEFTGRTEQ